MLKKLVIIGAGGLARETAWLVEEINREKKQWDLIGFIDENKSLNGCNINGYSVLGDLDYLNKLTNDIGIVVAIGDGRIRKLLVEKIKDKDFVTLLHPKIEIHESVKVGEGSIVFFGNILSVNSCIGKHVIMNFKSVLGHDAKLNDFVTVLTNVNISGNVTVGENTLIGTNVSILQEIKVGENCVIGIGSVVLKKVKDGTTVLGNPAIAYNLM